MGTSWAMSIKCRLNLVTSYYNTVDTIELVHHQIVNSQEFDSSVPFILGWAQFTHYNSSQFLSFSVSQRLKLFYQSPLSAASRHQSLSSILSPSLTFAIPRAGAELDSSNCDNANMKCTG